MQTFIRAFFMKKSTKTSLFFAVVLAIFSLANAQDFESQRLQDKINSIEKDLNILQKQFYRNKGGNNSSGSYSPNAEVRLTQLEENLQSINGRFEETNFRLDSLSRKLDKIVEDIDYRLQNLEKNSNKNTAQEEQEDPSAPIDLFSDDNSSKENSDNSYYDQAFTFMRQAKYDAAEDAFKKFIEKNPESELLGGAYFWLGETYFMRNEYSKAAVNFMKGYRVAEKTDEKAAESLFKLGSALAKMDKKSEACATFKKFETEFSKVDANLKSRLEAEKKALSC